MSGRPEFYLGYGIGIILSRLLHYNWIAFVGGAGFILWYFYLEHRERYWRSVKVEA